MTVPSVQPDVKATSGPAPGDPVRVVPLFVLTAVVVLAQLYVSIPLQAPIGNALGRSGLTAALASGYAICYAVGFLIYGPVSDHVGQRPVLLIGLAALSVTTLGVGLTTSIPALAILRALQGAAAATFAPSALAYLGTTLPPQRRAGAIGAMSVAFLAAGVIGQVAAAAIAPMLGWRWVFFLGGAALVGLTAVLTRVVPTQAHSTQGRPLTERFVQLGRFATRRPAVLLAVGHLMVLGGFVGFYTLIGPHLAEHGLSANKIMTVRAVALPAMFLSLAAGPIMRRFGAAATAAGALLVAGGGLMLACTAASSTMCLTGASVIFVGGVAVVVPSLITVWGDAAAPQRGIGMAVNGFVLFLGASLGAYVPNLASGFTTPLVILALGYAIAAALVFVATRAFRPAA